MGQWKKDIEDENSCRGVAVGISIKAGVLYACPIHEGIIFEWHGDVEDAYRLGNALYTTGEKTRHAEDETFEQAVFGCFETRRQMTDAIKEVNDLWYPTECPMCEKA